MCSMTHHLFWFMGLTTRHIMQRLSSGSSSSLASPNLGEQDVPGLVSLNQICLLEQQGIPTEILQCVFSSVGCCCLSMLDGIDNDPLLMSCAPIFSDMSKLCKLIRKKHRVTVYNSMAPLLLSSSPFSSRLTGSSSASSDHRDTLPITSPAPPVACW